MRVNDVKTEERRLREYIESEKRRRMSVIMAPNFPAFSIIPHYHLFQIIIISIIIIMEMLMKKCIFFI
jgi:hypothetical protein